MRVGVIVLLVLGLAVSGLRGQELQAPVRIEMQTELGTVTMELYPEQAPVTVSNFLRYVDEGFFDGGSFYRTVRADNQPNNSIRIAVIQGDIAGDLRGEGYPAIALEPTSVTGLLHRDGSLSMARAGPDTATSSFFICVGDQPELDFGGARNRDGQGFAAYGIVVEGMDVVRAINQASAEAQRLTPAISIVSVRRVGG